MILDLLPISRSIASSPTSTSSSSLVVSEASAASCLDRADAHVGGVDAGDTAGEDPAEGLGAELFDARLRRDQGAGGAVVQGRGVARGHRPALAEDGAELRHALQRGVRARPLVGPDDHGLATPRRLQRRDLLGEGAALGGRDRALVAAEPESVLGLA